MSDHRCSGLDCTICEYRRDEIPNAISLQADNPLTTEEWLAESDRLTRLRDRTCQCGRPATQVVSVGYRWSPVERHWERKNDARCERCAAKVLP